MRGFALANEEQAHVALPKLYGAPAYARPVVVPVASAERPFDPDALPIEAEQTEEERELARQIASGSWIGSDDDDGRPSNHSGSRTLGGRPFRLRLVGGRRRSNTTTNGGS